LINNNNNNNNSNNNNNNNNSNSNNKLLQLSSLTLGIFTTEGMKLLIIITNLLAMTHFSILPIFSNSLPVEDDLCHRVLHFMCQCFNTNCALVNFVARNGIFYSGMLSPVRRNIALCSRRYRLDIKAFIYDRYVPDLLKRTSFYL